MGSARSASAQRRVFAIALPSALLVLAVTALLLDPRFSLSTRQMVSSVALVFAGLAGLASCFWRVSQTRGRRRRSWLLLGAAAAVAILSNVFAAATGQDPVESPTWSRTSGSRWHCCSPSWAC